MYPRTGPNTSSWTKAEQVWCSPDRNDALTRAKLGQDLKAKPCADNPVARTYQLGQDFSLQGTPAIILADGDLLPGYVPPDVLVKQQRRAPLNPRAAPSILGPRSPADVCSHRDRGSRRGSSRQQSKHRDAVGGAH